MLMSTLSVERRFIREAHGPVWMMSDNGECDLWRLERVSRSGQREVFLIDTDDFSSLELLEMYVEDHNGSLQLKLPLS